MELLEEKWGFYNGKREGVARRWTKNEKLQLESYYKNNRLTGVYKTWLGKWYFSKPIFL